MQNQPQTQTPLALAIVQAKAQEAQAKAQEAEAKAQEARAAVASQSIRATERAVVFLLVGGFIAVNLDDEAIKGLVPVVSYFLGVATNHYFRS
ncbi:MAG: hypothetical protein ACPGWR_08040 [Ardenticatenaceae bacterium]